MNEKGLISRTIFSEGTETVTLKEVWDLRVQGCPFLAVRLSPFGQDLEARMFERLITFGRHEDRPALVETIGIST